MDLLITAVIHRLQLPPLPGPSRLAGSVTNAISFSFAILSIPVVTPVCATTAG